ncbi:MAG: protoheme IX farnesyltransferase [Burkholderiales bacterium]|nr:protoheme IX farnesyltransferase [Burkholderiales bacterium]
MQDSLAIPRASVLTQFYQLTKPRVVSLIVFTAVIGMFLATPVMVPWQVLLPATLGIALVAGAAAAINCLVEQRIDAKMARTRGRPTVQGSITSTQTLALAALIGGAGLVLLARYVNTLTMWLTLGTFVGYAVIYTVILKPATPQNIVIGGAAGAMPPVLGWAAVTGSVSADALLLFLIIFAWTPPHFWALALYRKNEYAEAGVPMLPVTHGARYTRLSVLLYTLILVAVTLLPLATGMAGGIYLVSMFALNGIFLFYAIRIYRNYSDALARATFAYSIVYLTLLFAALLVDHYFHV